MKAGALLRRGPDMDAAAMGLGHDEVRNRQPEPGALARRLGREERLENPANRLRRNAGPVVLDLDHDILPLAPCAHGDGRFGHGPAGQGLRGVAQQIEDDLLYLGFRAPDARHPFLEVTDNLDAPEIETLTQIVVATGQNDGPVDDVVHAAELVS